MRDFTEPTTVDWAAIRERLRAAEEALARDAAPAAAETRRILRARAQALAQAPAQADATATLVVLEFQLGAARYAVEAAFVREVYPLKDLTPLAGTPPFVAGIMNVRGQILAVLDLRQIFGLPAPARTGRERVIILHDGVMEFGILADAVISGHTLPLADIRPLPPTVSGKATEYLRGVTAAHLAVLDAARILADPHLVIADDI